MALVWKNSFEEARQFAKDRRRITGGDYKFGQAPTGQFYVTRDTTPAELAAIQGKSYSGGGSGGGGVPQPTPSASSSSGVKTITEQDALRLGLDWNNLPAGYARANQDPLSSVNKTLEDTFRDLQNEVTKRFGEYRAGKAFRVDEVLAEKNAAAKEQIDPYYNQLLGDYLQGVTTKINRGVDDTKDLLSELNASAESYSQESRNTLQDALNTAEEGYAQSGLYGSGEQLRTGGRLAEKSQGDLSDYLRKSSLQEKGYKVGLNRDIEDIGAEKKGYVSNLERNRFTDVQQRASNLTKEAGQQYISGFQATLPPELQSASGFDMLKSLGIYS